MRKFAVDHPVEAVVAVDDQATLAAAAISSALSLGGNSPASVYAAMNKYRMRELLRDAGVPVPDFRLVPIGSDLSSLANDMEYPVVIKPLMMAASRGVIRANNRQEFMESFARVAQIVTISDGPGTPGARGDAQARSNVLVESYVPGWEVAVEGLVTNGRLETLAIFDKPDPLEGPVFPETIYVTPCRLNPSIQRRIVAMTERTVRALDLVHGPIHAELRGDDAMVTIIEIAARSIGGLCSRMLRFEGGLSLEDIILRHALGLFAKVPPLETPSTGVMMMQAQRTGRFVGVDRLEEARKIGGIDEIIVSAHPGREIEALPEGFLYLGFIFASGNTPESVEGSLREALNCIDIVMEGD